MRNELDLLREVLLKVDNLTIGTSWPATSFAGFNTFDVLHCVQLAIDEQLVVGKFSRSGKIALVHRLTSAGKTFLDLARSDLAWATAKRELDHLGGPITIASMSLALTRHQAQTHRADPPHVVRSSIQPGSDLSQS